MGGNGRSDFDRLDTIDGSGHFPLQKGQKPIPLIPCRGMSNPYFTFTAVSAIIIMSQFRYGRQRGVAPVFGQGDQPSLSKPDHRFDVQHASQN